MQDRLRLWKKEVFSIPNLLSYLRLALIPVICAMYKKQEYFITAILVVISGLTDLLDGYIARHFDMITDLGKVVDPVADKLTQFALVLLLQDRYPWFLSLVLLLVVKELFMGVMGLIVVHNQKQVHSAIWCGKLSTMVFYCVMILLLFFPNLSEFTAEALAILCASAMLLSLIVYAVYYVKLIKTSKKAK